jgi:hypothetical protein
MRLLALALSEWVPDFEHFPDRGAERLPTRWGRLGRTSPGACVGLPARFFSKQTWYPRSRHFARGSFFGICRFLAQDKSVCKYPSCL